MNVEIELDGRKYAGKYRLERSTVIVTSDYGTTVGKKSHLPSKVVAEALLLEIVKEYLDPNPRVVLTRRKPVRAMTIESSMD